MKRGVGYCENTDCEDYAKGVFLLNHGDTFYCPRCRQLRTVFGSRSYARATASTVSPRANAATTASTIATFTIGISGDRSPSEDARCSTATSVILSSLGDGREFQTIAR